MTTIEEIIKEVNEETAQMGDPSISLVREAWDVDWGAPDPYPDLDDDLCEILRYDDIGADIETIREKVGENYEPNYYYGDYDKELAVTNVECFKKDGKIEIFIYWDLVEGV